MVRGVQASAVDLKFLSLWPQARLGTSNPKNRTRIVIC
jgi:hypothetical protein